MILEQYSELRYCRIKKKEKAPFEKEWQKKPYTFEEIQQYFVNENYGVLCGYGKLIIIDADEKELQIAVQDQLPDTLRIKTGGGGYHNYFFCKDCKNKIVLTSDKHYGEIQSWGSQCVGVGSIHPNGNTYEITNNSKIAEISFDQIKEFIKPFSRQSIDFNFNKEDVEDYEDFIQEILPKWKEGERQELCLSVAGYLRKEKRLGFNKVKKIIVEICKRTEDQELEMRLRGVIETFKKDEKEVKGYSGLKNKIPINVFTKFEQAKRFNEIQPIFFDKSGMFWLWNNQIKCWEISDDVDILNMISETTGKDVISSKSRTEILNALKQEGRLKIPRPIEKTWIQFKDKIYDIKTGKSFEATPNYFVTNPIPYEVSHDPQTPVIDKIFEEWVGKEYVKTLHEIIAYSLLPDYPMNRLFCFIGAGMNGKSCFLNLLKKFIGDQNVCSTELDTLLSSRFEITKLHKKLVCLMGETNFNEMNRTSILKKLTGRDTIGFEYKNKNPFQDINYAKIMIATNNLPTTTDKTIGFYRRWLIIDFPNEFSEKKNILDDIPEQEYNNLATNCVIVLNSLLEERNFTNEGSIDERMKKFEDRSDPLEKFMKEFTIEDYDGYIWKFEFEKRLNEWCKENGFRHLSELIIGKKMKQKGVEQIQKQADWLTDGQRKYFRSWMGIKWL